MADRFTEDLIALLPRMRRLALALSRRADLADDLVQTAAERALAGRTGFDPGTRFDAWVFRILRNAWIDTIRRVRTRGAEIDIVDTPEAATVDGTRVTEAVLMLDTVRAAVMRLPDEQREVMMLVCVEDMSYRETAEILGIPIGTVMSRLARARQEIARLKE